MRNLLKLDKEISISGIYTFYYLEHSKSYYYVGEKHNFWELVYVDSGEISAIADSNGYTLSQGDIIFHKPMEFHSMAAVNKKPHNVLVITFETDSPAMDFFSNKIFTVNPTQKKLLNLILKEFRDAFGAFYSSVRKCDFTLDQHQKWAYEIGVLHIEHFLLELMREDYYVKRSGKINKLAKKNVENAIVESIKEYLSENLYANLTLADICNHFNMSKSYLCQLFKNETEFGIIDYYIDLKIKEAKFLIREGRLNFTQIAEKLGYNSLQHFTRTFKTKVKMPPRLYEKSIE